MYVHSPIHAAPYRGLLRLKWNHAFLILLGAFFVFSLAGCDLFPGDEDEQELTLAETDDPLAPFAAAHSDGSNLVALSSGGLAGVNGVVYTTSDGQKVGLELDSQGLPQTLHIGGAVVLFENFRADEVDLAVILPDGEIEIVRDAPLGDAGSAQLAALLVASKNASTFTDAVKALGLSLNIAVCTVGTPVALATGVGAVAGTGLALTCASALLAVLQESGNLEGTVADIAGIEIGAFAAAFDAIGCNPSITSFVNCLQALVGSINVYIDTRDLANESIDGQVQLARGVLRTGAGEVKVTLTWNNTADLDLWVTDPCGEAIGWSHRTSQSGGQLDVDDTSGFGPENIFWLNGTAPPGSYQVEVDHFSGPGPSTFDIFIQHPGDPITQLRGSINTDERRTITNFTVTGTSGVCGATLPKTPAPATKPTR